MDKLESLYVAGSNIKIMQRYGKKDDSSSKTLKIELPYDSTIALLGIYPKELTEWT